MPDSSTNPTRAWTATVEGNSSGTWVRKDEAESRLDAVERERDEARRCHEEIRGEYEESEARLGAYETALREIADSSDLPSDAIGMVIRGEHDREVARAVLSTHKEQGT